MQNTYKRFKKMKYPLIIESFVVGIFAGLLAVLYRVVLAHIDDFREHALSIAQSGILPMLGWFIALIIMAYVVAHISRHEPLCGGSGIPQVEGELQGNINQNWFRVIWTKMIGGFICIIAGLSVGREGPSIQLGAMAGKGVSRTLGRLRVEERFLITCGASAGLAAAFNAPLSGVMFALEEVHKSFSAFVLLSAMTASITADCVSRMILGSSVAFELSVSQPLPISMYPLVLILGLIAGAAGAFYNKTMIKAQATYDKINSSLFVKMLIPFGFAGLFGMILPEILGGGHHMVEMLNIGMATKMLLLLLVAKFIFSIISFSSGVPGGIFFPILVLGAYLGASYGQTAMSIFGFDEGLVVNFTILAMAGLLTAIVRAPITSIVLIMELTGSFQSLYALLIVTLSAYITAELFKSEPIYDTLLHRVLKKNGKAVKTDDGQKLMFEYHVENDSQVVKSKVNDLFFPEGCLLIGVKRATGGEIIPKKDTVIRAGDTLIVLVEEQHSNESQRILNSMTTFFAG